MVCLLSSYDLNHRCINLKGAGGLGEGSCKIGRVNHELKFVICRFDKSLMRTKFDIEISKY